MNFLGIFVRGGPGDKEWGDPNPDPEQDLDIFGYSMLHADEYAQTQFTYYSAIVVLLPCNV